jgi:Flp pilus assembly protein TadD
MQSDIALLLGAARYDEAEQLCRRLLIEREAQFGIGHSRTLSTKNDLGFVLKYRGKLEEAERLYRNILLVEQETGWDNSTRLSAIKNNLALVLRHQGRFDEAERMHREELELTEVRWGKGHLSTVTSQII